MSEFNDRLPDTFYTMDDGIAMMDELPYSIEAESSVLGALLMDNRAWEQVSDTLKEDDFYRAEHRHIFSVIAEQINKSLTADVITVFEALSRKDLDERVGGILYLNTLAQYVPSSANIRRYATLVRERSVLRQLIEAGTDVVQVARKPKGRSVQEIVDQCEQMIFSVGQKNPGGKTNTFPINDLVGNLLDTIQQRADNPSDVTGLPTGFSDLDRMTTGLQPGDLIVLAARPSMGKTSFAVNIAENVAITEKLPVAIFSMEMGANQLAVRILGSVGRVDQGRLRTGKLEQDDWGRLTEAVEKIQTASIDIDESPGLTPAELRSNARRMARKHGKLGLIVVDYLQLMSGSSSGGGDNRATELGEISRGLKMLAKELQCPVIALSQLNRSVEQRTDKRPLMSDLRESGAIEQDADIIMFIYRDDYYNPESKEPNIAELIIGKQRNGPTGTVKLYFQKALTKFESLASNSEY